LAANHSIGTDKTTQHREPIQRNKLNKPLTTLGQETRWAYSANPEHHTGHILAVENMKAQLPTVSEGWHNKLTIILFTEREMLLNNYQ